MRNHSSSAGYARAGMRVTVAGGVTAWRGWAQAASSSAPTARR